MKAKGKRDYLALSLLVSSVAFTGIFVVACLKKKSLVAALAAVAALNTVGGMWLVSSMRKKNGGYLFDLFDEGDYEVFDDEEAKRADRTVRSVLYGKRSGDNAGRTAAPIRQIPVDDTATEAEFIK